MQVVILCGGLGTRLRDVAQDLPKPMVPVGDRPILWHIMKGFAHAGLDRFVLCLGYQSWVIKRYFLDYHLAAADFTLGLGQPESVQLHGRPHAEDWQITLAETGRDAMTGCRLHRVAKYIDGDDFMLTYGDGLADVDIPALLAFHRAHGRAATVTGVRPPGRFGELVVDGPAVRRFSEKPVETGHINGGFFAFKRRFLDYVVDDDACILERVPLERAAEDGELMMFEHAGFWQCMDTYRDLLKLEAAWNGGEAPWRTW